MIRLGDDVHVWSLCVILQRDHHTHEVNHNCLKLNYKSNLSAQKNTCSATLDILAERRYLHRPGRYDKGLTLWSIS